jgi:hypothetical protein
LVAYHKPQEVIKILLSKKVLHVTKTWTYGDISVMIPALLISVESFVIAIVFFFAYSPKKYFITRSPQRFMEAGIGASTRSYCGGFLGVKALFEALFMWDLITSSVQAFKFVPSVFGFENGSEHYAHQVSSSVSSSCSNGSFSRCDTDA